MQAGQAGRRNMTEIALDWNEVWKKRHRTVNGIMRTGGCAALWESEDAARLYSEEVLADRCGRISTMIGALDIRPGMRILDIGPGPGAFEIRLAPGAERMTVVEPASGMASVLEENLSTHEITNVSLIRKRWEDVSEQELDPPFALTVSAFSLGMEDLAGSLNKMTKVTSGTVNVFWFSALTPWAIFRRALWRDLHGEELPEGNLCDVIFNLLFAEGICPEVIPLSYSYTDEYASEEELIKRNRIPFRLESRKLEERFLELAMPHMKTGDEGFSYSGTVQFALLRWSGWFGRHSAV